MDMDCTAPSACFPLNSWRGQTGVTRFHTCVLGLDEPRVLPMHATRAHTHLENIETSGKICMSVDTTMHELEEQQHSSSSSSNLVFQKPKSKLNRLPDQAVG